MILEFNIYDKRYHDYRWICSFDLVKNDEHFYHYHLVDGYVINANGYNVKIVKEDEHLIVMDLPVSFIMRQGLVEAKGFAVEILDLHRDIKGGKNGKDNKKRP